jgi:diguanylate cyclase (GGDEF)-like protein/PAS domain S-box-containing protein
MLNSSVIELVLLAVILTLIVCCVFLYKKFQRQHAHARVQQQALEVRHATALAAATTQKYALHVAQQVTETRLRLLLDSAAEGIYGLDLNGRFSFVNKAALRMLDYADEGELIGKNAHQQIHHTQPDGTAYSATQSGMFRAQQDGHQLHEDVDVLWTKTGRALPVELWFYPIYEDANVTGSVVTFIDISEALRLEASRAASEHKFQHLMNTSPDAVLISDFTGVLKYVNQAALDLLGYSRQELIGKSYFSLLPSDWLAGSQQRFSELIKANNQAQLETRLLHRSGRKIALDLSANSVFSDGLLYGTFRDISQRKEVEKNMKQMVQRLSLVTSAAQLGVVDFDLAADILQIDARGCELHGLAVQGGACISYAEYQKTIHPEDLGRLDKAMQQVISGEQPNVNLQFRTQLNNGAVRNLEASIMVNHEEHQAVRILGVCRDITQQKMDEYEINLLAFYDPLTKLPNRRLLMDNLKHAVAMSEHTHSYGAVLFLDLDNFKKLNDTRGHDVGDLLLLEVASRLRSCLREGDTVGRLGGDEFVVILESLSTQSELATHQTELVAEKITSILAQPYELDELLHQTTSSMGVSLFFGHQESVDELLKHADSAMYQAKAAGRGVFRFYDAEVQRQIEQRDALEADLRAAIERTDELQLHYQIQVDNQGHPLGAEILLRWQHPLKGMIYPSQFIPLAEESGLIVPIGDWILKRAVVQLKIWQSDPLMQHINLAVNVSERQFSRDDFVKKLKRLLQFTGANPQMLKLELTESTMLQDIASVIDKMQQLQKIGVRFSLDDFGTGYSSLAYLKKLPLDQIKIDQSFVRDISTDPNDAAIVEMIIAMSKSLQLSVIAEGVETLAQRDFLAHHGCHAYQGYLYGKPVCLEDFVKLVHAKALAKQPLKHHAK